MLNLPARTLLPGQIPRALEGYLPHIEKLICLLKYSVISASSPWPG